MGPLMHFTPKIHRGASQVNLSIKEKPATDTPLFRDAVRGIVPGYQGHVPGARDNYGQSHVGGVSYEKWQGRNAGPQTRHGQREGTAGSASTSPAKQFKESVRGIVPGYGGFRIGVAEECGASAFGGVPIKAPPEAIENPTLLQQGNRSWRSGDSSTPPQSFRDQVHGVMPGYTGFIPNKYTKCGESHYGHVLGNPSKEQGTHPKSREKGDKELHISMRVKPGYSAHVPGARDSFGAATASTYDFVNGGY